MGFIISIGLSAVGGKLTLVFVSGVAAAVVPALSLTLLRATKPEMMDRINNKLLIELMNNLPLLKSAGTVIEALRLACSCLVSLNADFRAIRRAEGESDRDAQRQGDYRDLDRSGQVKALLARRKQSLVPALNVICGQGRHAGPISCIIPLASVSLEAFEEDGWRR